MTPWQTWLQTLGQQQNSGTNPQWAAQWQQAWKQWQTTMEGAWTTPSSYWQAIAGIQSARARTVAEWWQQQPQYFAQLFQCKTFPQLVECLTRWQGHTLTSAINLGVVTQAHTGNFMAQWRNQMPFLNASPSTLASMWKSTQEQRTTPAPQSTHSPQPAQPQPSMAHPVRPAQSTSQPQQTTQPQFNLVNNGNPPAQASSSLTSAEPTATPHATVSSTANSVMRTAAGSTIAAAAARRSVVARRASGNRRRAAR